MRRKDREVTDIEKIKQIISQCYCCRLGLNDNGKIYIVPLNFGFTKENNQFVFYFHSAKEGRKIDVLKNNSYVGFEMDTNYHLLEGHVACQYSSCYQSIIGEGYIEFVHDMKEKKKGFQYIMQHYTHHNQWEYSTQMLESVCMFKLIVTEMSCKEH